MTKIFIFAVSIFCLSLTKKSHIIEQQKDNSVITIDFQYNFKQDIIDVKINNVLIVHHMLLNSNYIGYTELSLKIDRATTNQYKINYLDKFKYCINSPQIKLSLKLNGKIFEYLLDPRNGKWVGFGKDTNNTFAFLQQNEPFIYE